MSSSDKTIRALWPHGSLHGLAAAAKHQVYGVEHEIENFVSWGNIEAHVQAMLSSHEDGTLIQGIELVTAPVGIEDQIVIHKQLQEQVQYNGSPGSERCSTHVHCDVSKMTFKQLKALMLMYCLTEPTFFTIAGPERETNIHCVPLWATTFPSKIFAMNESDFMHHAEGWSKYTALNMHPLYTQYTLEFRQLGYVTNKTFTAWMRYIDALFAWAKQDDGKFLDVLDDLLTDYAQLIQYIKKNTGKFGKLFDSVLRFTNGERLYDCYISALYHRYPAAVNVAYLTNNKE